MENWPSISLISKGNVSDPERVRIRTYIFRYFSAQVYHNLEKNQGKSYFYFGVNF
jgi:hypothetical protein